MRRLTLLAIAIAAQLTGCGHDTSVPVAPRPGDAPLTPSTSQSPAELREGRRIFRYDTFGDETFWTDTLRMHEVIAASVSPATALSVGLKVDANALPDAVKAGIANGTIDLQSP